MRTWSDVVRARLATVGLGVFLAVLGCSRGPEGPGQGKKDGVPPRGQADVEAARAKLSAEDAAAVAAQEWCPVSQARLGTMGVPDRITLAGRKIFLCCNACRTKAERNTDDTFTRVDEFKEVQAERAKLSPEDRKLVDAQDVCVVMTESKLGSMGPPPKLLIQDQPVFVCCKSCIKKAQANPEKSLRKQDP